MIACVPAAVVGLLFDDILDKIFYKPLPVAVMLIVYGVLFIIVENRNEGRKPAVRRISELDIKTVSYTHLISIFLYNELFIEISNV